MKNTLLTLVSVLFFAITFAQTVPQGINYQAVARDANGDELINQTLTIQLSVFSGSPTGILDWQEEHSVTTNEFGLFTAIIGQGAAAPVGLTTFDQLNWGTTSHYLKVEINTGNGYIDMGTAQFMSVPYALHAGNSVFEFNTNGTGIQGPTDTASGTSSIAMGSLTIASGNYSTSTGRTTTASGNKSTAMGNLTIASGEHSTAMGRETEASGQSSTAMGNNTEASGAYSTAMGYDTEASGVYSTAMGEWTIASGDNSTAMGNSTNATGDYSTVMGRYTNASGHSSTAMGNQTDASGDYSTAMGRYTVAPAISSTAMGYNTDATGDYSTVMGRYTEASGDNSTAMGSSTNATGHGSTAMGYYTAATGSNSTAMGEWTIASGQSSTTMGYSTIAADNFATALGHTTHASGIASTSVGKLTTASGYSSTAMGNQTDASGHSSTAMGYGTTALGDYSTAMGYGTTALGSRSIAIGHETKAESYGSLAIGRHNIGGGDAGNWISTDPVFEVGNGSGVGQESNALTVLKNGNVGIGTSSPIRGKLQVMGNHPCCGTTQGTFNYHIYSNGVDPTGPTGSPWRHFGPGTANDNFDISVYADGRFMGSGIHIFSDERIKDIVGLSNSKKDLSTLLSLEITDYKMKDKTKGEKPYKKVIAQQVKQVYPQAISLTTEVVPDIYKVSIIDNGYISLETDLKPGDKVRLILEDEMSLFDVISADKNGFKVATDKSGKVFVYGREVDDFHSVDYESLSMLNVSATQELYKLISEQQKIIDSQNTELAEMQTNFDERLKEIEQILNTTTNK